MDNNKKDFPLDNEFDNDKEMTEKNEYDEALGSSEQTSPSQDCDPCESGGESSSPKQEIEYETSDSWEFEAEAKTIGDKALEDAGFDIDASQLEIKELNKKAETVNSGDVVIKRDRLVFVPVAILTILVTAVLIFLGVRYYTVPNGKEGDLMNPAAVVAKIGDTKVSVGMFNYYYSQIVSYYESYAGYGYFNLDTTKDYATQYTTDENGNKVSWKEFFENAVMDEIEANILYYDAAVKEGYTLTAKQQEAVNTQLDYFKEQASQQNTSLNDFLEENLGEYCTEDTVRTMLEQILIASTYKGVTKDSAEITDEEINKIFSENSQKYNTINYCSVSLAYDSSSEESKKKSDDLIKSYMSKIKDRDSLIALIPEIYKDFIDSQVKSVMESDSSVTKEKATEEAIKTCEQNIDATLNGSDEPFDKAIIDWLFSSDTKIGSVNYYVDKDTGYAYILLKTEEPTLLDDPTYSVRHILIQPQADGQDASSEQQATEFTEEQWDAAKDKADKILEEYNNSDKTEKTFAQLAEKESTDTGSTAAGSYGLYGGLYEGVVKGEMVEEFENWGFDKKRKYGDVEIVKSQYGYHIMFFVSQQPQYKAEIIKQLKEDALENSVKDIKTNVKKSVLNKAVEKYYTAKAEAAAQAD